MKKLRLYFAVSVLLLLAFFMSACSPVNKKYGVTDQATGSSESSENSVEHVVIMSSDQVMPQYFDIGLFDEENYSKVYLGKKFKFKIEYDGDAFTVPMSYKKLEKMGWQPAENGRYQEDSTVYACETAEMLFVKENGAQITAFFYNPTNTSRKLGKCNIVKFRIENSLGAPDGEKPFSVNGVNGKMAISDLIDSLGTPSHFYRISDESYYLDYFITAEDRRNGITVYVNPQDDSITAIEFSDYR